MKQEKRATRPSVVHVVTGPMNKRIAAATGLSHVTVNIHRAQVMRKMDTNHLADLVRGADRLKPLLGHAG